MVKRKTWDEFRDSGLLWFINSILHLFGWSIIVEKDEEKYEVYPARVNFRGFTEESNRNGYIKVSQYLKDNIDDILKETHE